MYKDFTWTGNVIGDGAYDVELYNPFGIDAVVISSWTVQFRQITLSVGPTVTFSITKGGAGVTIALANSTTTPTTMIGSSTSPLTIPANNSVWMRFTNCDMLGDMQANVNLSPTAITFPSLTSTDLDQVIALALGDKSRIVPQRRTYFINAICTWIQDRITLPQQGKKVTFTINATTGVGPYYFSTIGCSDLREVISLYIKDSNAPSSPLFINEEPDRDEFNRFRPDLYTLDNSQNIDNGYPALYNINQEDSSGLAFYLTPVAVSTTVTLEYRRFLTGSDLNYVFTHFPEPIQLKVLALLEPLKDNWNLKNFIGLNRLAREALVDQMAAEEHKKIQRNYNTVRIG